MIIIILSNFCILLEEDLKHSWHSRERSFFNIPEIREESIVEKDIDWQRIIVDDWIKMLETKIQDLVIILSTSKHYNINWIVRRMSLIAQK